MNAAAEMKMTTTCGGPNGTSDGRTFHGSVVAVPPSVATPLLCASRSSSSAEGAQTTEQQQPHEERDRWSHTGRHARQAGHRPLLLPLPQEQRGWRCRGSRRP